ncbi:hypothetical protein [Motilimonas eburnea]|uniref:hypothetical protein n=1 Tax=Motilimonas eburnea TaxID=1737488 RepID=UPI001E61771D|nr:hypothetical protein [Motilimonas eburnea]MCE2572655.1 hypothetical protein [Motilimonas eburnea]
MTSSVSASQPAKLSLMERLIGPYASPAEQWLSFGFSLMAGAVMALAIWLGQLDWHFWPAILAILLAMDIGGGIVSNACAGAKRWFHRQGINKRQHLIFIAFHGVQLGLFSWAFLDFDLSWLMAAWLWLMLAGTLILITPRYLQRPLAMALYMVSLMISFYWLTVPSALAWFLPLFYLKLLIAYLLNDVDISKEPTHD